MKSHIVPSAKRHDGLSIWARQQDFLRVSRIKFHHAFHDMPKVDHWFPGPTTLVKHIVSEQFQDVPIAGFAPLLVHGDFWPFLGSP